MDLFQLRNQFSQEGIMMCFNGPFSHSIIEEIGIAIRKHLAAENIAPMATQDVFAAYIEMTQNARNYLALRNISASDAGSATIVIARQQETYLVSSGNVILKDDISGLINRIDHINALDPDALKRSIRQQLRRDLPEEKQGAGIGLMEIARRSAYNLEYTFQNINDKYDFFTLTVKI